MLGLSGVQILLPKKEHCLASLPIFDVDVYMFGGAHERLRREFT